MRPTRRQIIAAALAVGGAGAMTMIGYRTNRNSIEEKQLDNVKLASEFSGSDGGTQIQNAISEANNEPGPNIIVINGLGPDDVSGSTGSVSDSARAQNAWKLTSHISIPSYTTLICRNSYIFLADGTDDNLVRNSDFSSGNEWISIVGDGNTVWDRNFANQTNYAKDAGNARLELGFRFFDVDHLHLRGFKTRRTGAWGIKAEDVTDVNATNLEFEQGTNPDYTNRDGIHIVGPAENVTIDNILGQTYDDAVAVGANEPSGFAYNDGPGGPVQNITVSNVNVEVEFAHAVRIFEGDDKSDSLHIIKDVTVSNVNYQDGGSGGGAVILGDGNDVDDATKFTDITVDGVTAQGKPALKVSSACRNVDVSGLTAKSAASVVEFNHGKSSSLADFKSNCSGWSINGVHGTEVSFILKYNAAGGWEDSDVTGLTLKSDGGTSLTAMIDMDGSDADVTGVSFSDIEGFANAGGGTDTGTLLRSTSTVRNLRQSTLHDVNVRQIDTFLDLQNGSEELEIWDIYLDSLDTAYANITSETRFRNSNVPPLASGSLTMSSGSTGVKSTTELAVTSQESRRPEVKFIGPDTGTTPNSDYEWQREESKILWDESAGAINVTIRANLVTDPGSDWELKYEVLPGTTTS